MRRAMWSAAAVLVLLVGGGSFAIGGIARAAGTTVNMVDGSGDPTTTWKFDPADITVAVGSTVKWHNNGQQPHTVTADDGSFKSSYISPGGDFTQAFPTAGTFAYHCDPHPWMKATVHVTGGSTATTVPATATTQPGTATTATTSPAAGATTTTTKPGASTTTTTAAAGATTTTTATSAGGTTATTAAPAQTSGADTAATTTTTAAAGTGNGESAASTHRQTDSGKTDGPLVALAAVLTLMLIGISGKLLLSKSRPH